MKERKKSGKVYRGSHLQFLCGYRDVIFFAPAEDGVDTFLEVFLVLGPDDVLGYSAGSVCVFVRRESELFNLLGKVTKL